MKKIFYIFTALLFMASATYAKTDENLNSIWILKKHFAQPDNFLPWYKTLSQENKNLVLAGTVALCRPDLAEIALANGGDINTKVSTYIEGGDDEPFVIYASTDAADEEKFRDKAQYIGDTINTNDMCCTYVKNKYPEFSGLLTNGVAACSDKDKAFDMTKLLIKHGADINENKDNYTPLSAAVANNNIKLTQFFLNNGADVASSDAFIRVLQNIKKDNEEAADDSLNTFTKTWKKVKKYKSTKIFDLLLPYVQKTKLSPEVETQAYFYSQHNDMGRLKSKIDALNLRPDYTTNLREQVLTAAGCNLKSSGFGFRLFGPIAFESLLFFAEKRANLNYNDPETIFTCMAGGLNDENIKYIEKLLDFGVDINLQNKIEGKTALMAAANNTESVKTIKLFLQRGAQIDREDDGGSTALVYASTYGAPENLELLLKEGAEVNHQDYSGETALFVAARRGYLPAAEILLKNGADIEHENIHGKTALFEAITNPRGTGIGIERKLEVAKFLLKKGADVNHRDKDGRTPLFTAILENTEEMVRLLLKNGADINIKDNKGQTPLFVAAQMNNANLVKLLLDNGADAGIVDNEGKNAFDNCVYSVCKLHEEGMKRFEVTADKLSRELRVNALMDDVFWISNDQCDIIMDYLDKGLDPYTVVEGAPLIAHLIGDEMNKRCLERVLKKGIDLTRKIRFKGKDYTPMAFALSRSCYDCDELLSRYGADKLAAEEEETYGEIKKVKQLERNMMGRVDGN